MAEDTACSGHRCRTSLDEKLHGNIFPHGRIFPFFIAIFRREKGDKMQAKERVLRGEKRSKVQVLQRFEGANSSPIVSDCTNWHTICII